MSKKLPGETYSSNQVELIFKQMSKRCPTGIRNRGLVSLLYGSGLRITEALNLYPRDVNIKNGEIFVRNGKGSKSRRVGLDSFSCSLLEYWVEKRKKLKFTGSHPLFCTLKGEKVSSDYVRGLFSRISKKIEKKTGEKIRIHAHGLRHTMATELLKEGFDIQHISDQLGHSSLATTQVYLKKLCPKQLISSIHKRERTLKV